MRVQISVSTLLLAVFLVASEAHSRDVLKFKIEQEVKNLMEIVSLSFENIRNLKIDHCARETPKPKKV